MCGWYYDTEDTMEKSIFVEVINDAIQNLENITSNGGILWDYVEADMCLDKRLKEYSLVEISDEMLRLADIYDQKGVVVGQVVGQVGIELWKVREGTGIIRVYAALCRPRSILVGKLLLYSKVFSKNFFRRNFAACEDFV